VDGNPGTIFQNFIGTFNNLSLNHQNLDCSSGVKNAVTHTSKRVVSVRNLDEFFWTTDKKPTSGYVTFYAIAVKSADYWVGEKNQIRITLRYTSNSSDINKTDDIPQSTNWGTSARAQYSIFFYLFIFVFKFCFCNNNETSL
jgi:hypothetical protein